MDLEKDIKINISKEVKLDIDKEKKIILKIIQDSRLPLTPLDIALELKRDYGMFLHLHSIILYLNDSFKGIVDKYEKNGWELVNSDSKREKLIRKKYSEKNDTQTESPSEHIEEQTLKNRNKHQTNITEEKKLSDKKEKSRNNLADAEDEKEKTTQKWKENTISLVTPKKSESIPSQFMPENEDRLSSMYLIKAVQEGDIRSVKNNLLKNANPNTRDKEGNTPLLIAVLKEHEEIIEVLLKEGANPNIINEDEIPLLRAMYSSNFKLLDLLFRYNADPNITDSDGDTPLAMAVRLNKLDMTVLLLDKRANPSIQNKNGETPIDMAKSKNDKRFYTLLIENNQEK